MAETSSAASTPNNALSSENSAFTTPQISLPKGGGAIKGIGEKFGTNPVTGTGSLSVPIFTTPGRSNLSPQLSLSYDSGAGNGAFGFGWHLSIPMVTRKTDKGLPRYHDHDESDVFILSEAEDLVPSLLQKNGEWSKESLQVTQNGVGYTVQRYRPRVEGLFARIERWRNNTTGETYWRSISKDNITSLYGQTPNSQIADADDSSRVFSWLLDTTYDDKGNVVIYEYKSENTENVTAALHELNRKTTANRYFKKIRYGNQSPYYPDGTLAQPVPVPVDWHFQVLFDYGEHNPDFPRVEEDTLWDSRPDAFSSYRAGFEVRTYRLCRRVLIFHEFAELEIDPCLVRSTDFLYSHKKEPSNPLSPVYSFIAAVSQTGYIWNAAGREYVSKSLPPLEFTYSEVKVDETLHFVDAASLENLPAGVDGSRYQWVDLDSEGLPGVLTEQADSWFYKRNLSNLPSEGSSATAHFETAELVATRPSLGDLGGGQQLMDLAGDGQLCLVQFSRPLSGFYERPGWRVAAVHSFSLFTNHRVEQSEPEIH